MQKYKLFGRFSYFCNVKSQLSTRLEAHGIRPTAIRLLVLDALGTDGRAYSLSELEAKLSTVDKSSVFRALTLFSANALVHCIEDSRGQTRYAPCHDDCRCHEGTGDMADFHPHFECERCARVWCLRSEHLPVVELPEGFCPRFASYVVKGLCPQCKAHRRLPKHPL